MKPILIPMFALISNIALPQSLSQTSKNIKIAFEKLENDAASKSKQLAYLKVFPQNKQQFIEIFDPVDYSQLYSDSHQYINAFIALAKYYPTEVIDKSINIGKNLNYDADAIAFMQRGIVKLGNENAIYFSKKINSLPKIELSHLITFLADVENHKAYHEYQQLIDVIKKIHQNKLAVKFINARAQREKDSRH